MSDTKEIIERGLGSIGKIKIMKALSEESKMSTIYILHKKTQLKRQDIKKNLDELVEIGWVKQVKYANTVYGVNSENNYASQLIEFFKNTGYIS